MLTFFSCCAALFSATFNAACGLDYFKFLAAVLLVLVAFNLFLLLSHGFRKM